MDYAVHSMPSYQHLQGTAKRAHEGSQSQGHSNNSTRYSTGMSAPSSKKGSMPESKGPGGMDM